MRSISKPWYETIRYDENGCRVCSNVKNQDGYVRVRGYKIGKNGLVMLHVLQWVLTNGDIPDGMEINHKCGNRGCCNLEHLELICGSAHASVTNVQRKGYTKLHKSDEVVFNLYKEVMVDNLSINKACLKYGIKRSTLSSIINKRSRCNVTDLVDKEYSLNT